MSLAIGDPKTLPSFVEVMSDIHLLIGGYFAMAMPILGFILATVLVRFKSDYNKCLKDKWGLDTDKKIKE